MKLYLSIIFVMCLLTINLSAQKIHLKGSFLSGFKFSTDSISYENVGTKAAWLKKMMKDDGECTSLLNSYSSLKIFGIILGYPGGFLVGWPIGGYIGGGEWKKGYSAMIITGGALTFTSILIEYFASNNLKKAVERYNDRHSASSDNIDLGFMYNENAKNLQLGITVKF